MKVIIDERETALYDACYSILASQVKPSFSILSKEVLTVGDILVQTDDGKDVLLIERKTFADMLSSIKDGRYDEQSYRLLHSSGFPPHSIFYVLEGVMSQLFNPADKKILWSSMTSLQFFKGFSMQRTASTRETAEWILCMADKIEREFGKGKTPYYLSTPFWRIFKNSSAAQETPSSSVSEQIDDTKCDTTPPPERENITSANYCSVVKKVKKDNITPENIGEIILCQIPGISSVTAIAIMKNFRGFPHLMDELKQNPHCLDGFTVESNGKLRKISKACIENIRKFFLHKENTTVSPAPTA